MRIAIGQLPALLLAMLFAGPSLAPAQERELVVGTSHAPPFSMRDESGEWSGISIGLWRSIADDLDLAFEFRELELNQLLDGLEDGSIDVVVAALTVTGEREARFDFSHSYYGSGLAIAVKARPDLGLLGVLRGLAFTAFLRALAVLIGVIWVAGALVWVFERRRNPDQFGGRVLRGLGEAFWWSAVTMTTVGYGDKAPKTPGGRFFALIWMFTSIVIISGLTAAITSALTVGSLQTDITRSSDLRRYRVATVAGTTSQAWLERNTIRTREFPTARDGLEAVATGEIVAEVYDSPILRYLAVSEFEGRIQVLPHRFELQIYALGLQNNSALRESVNRALLHQTASASWARLMQRYLGEAG
jgi:ABC-type amino acid transport substrate-binding protein